MPHAKLIQGLRSAYSLVAHSPVLASGIPMRPGLLHRRDVSSSALMSPRSRRLPRADVAITPMGDSLTAAMAFDVGSINRSDNSVHNWALARFGQPWFYTGFFGVSGQTSIDMLARMATALAATQAAVQAGKRTYFSDWSGTNDAGLLADSASVIAARRISMATQAQAVGARPMVWRVTGSELFNPTQTQTLIDMNAAMKAWVDAMVGDPLHPVWCDIASRMWFRDPDTTMTDSSVCLLQTPAAGVPLSINGPLAAGGVATFPQGTKLLFTHAETTKTITVNGTDPSGNAISETVTLTTGVALKSSFFIYKTVTSITASVAFTNPLKVGGCCINQKQGYPYDGLHPTVMAAWDGAQAMWDCISADCTPNPILRLGTRTLLNPDFTTLTGGTLGTNTTCSSGATPPLNWRTNNSSATAITACDYFFRQGEGFCDLNFTTSASAALASAFLRHDPAPSLFTPGKTYDLWMRVFIPKGGSQSMVNVSVELSLNYASGTKLYYADRASSVNQATIPSPVDQWLTYRFAGIPVDGSSSLNSVNFFVRAHATGAGTNKLSMGAFALLEVPS